MSLEQSMEKLAAAYEKYTAVIEKQIELTERMLEAGVTLIGPSSTSETPKSIIVVDDKPKRGRKSNAEKEAEAKAVKSKKVEEEEEDDDFGDDEKEEADDFGDDDDSDKASASKYTADQIKDLLFKVKDKKGPDAARGIVKECGVNTIAQIPEKDYAKVVSAAKKLGVSL